MRVRCPAARADLPPPGYGRRTSSETEAVFTRLTPILPVASVPAELAFYELLGFQRHIDPLENYPVDEFAAVTSGDAILFGLSVQVPWVGPPAAVEWQFETTDIDTVGRRATDGGLDVALPVTVQAWGRRMMTVRSPSGYAVNFEQV